MVTGHKAEVITGVEIKELKSIDDHVKMRSIMNQVWGQEFMVPSHLSFKIGQYGGVVLGAYVEGEMIGFTLSFPMYWNYLHGLYIHMTAVLPQFQHHSVGMRLRLHLGVIARARGHRMVTWTFDPLESPNARLNIGKIGGICNEYMVNYYGTMNDNRNRGIESDRFQAQWWIETPRVSLMLDQYSRGVDLNELTYAGLHESEVNETAGLINDTVLRSDGLLASDAPRLNMRDRELLLRVPKSFQVVKQHDIDLAHQWRMQTRSVFTTYFARGWTATGYLPGSTHNTYVLQK